MRAVAQAWRAAGGEVLGLAVSENAARELGRAARIRAENTAKFLFEHRRPDHQKDRPGWPDQWAVKQGALLMLDEAAMASRQTIDHLRAMCHQSGAKLVLVGDHEQLASPEAGGLFQLVVDHVGAAQLDQVHRLDAEWERRARALPPPVARRPTQTTPAGSIPAEWRRSP